MFSREIEPYTHLVYTSQQVSEAARPPQAPEMAAVAVHLLQDRQQAIGTTADPMSTPMSRYTYLQGHTPPLPVRMCRAGARALDMLGLVHIDHPSLTSQQASPWT